MRIFIIGLIVLISPLLSYGHNPLSARYHLDAGEMGSVLSINLSQDGVNNALLKMEEKEQLEKMNRAQWEEMIVAYIKKNFSLSVDGKNIALAKGGIKYGSHQTDLKFALGPISAKTEKLKVSIPAFEENENHQTIFSYNLGEKKAHKILSEQNNFEATIAVNEISKTTRNSYWIFMLLLIFPFSFFLFKWRAQKVDSSANGHVLSFE